MRSEKQKDGRPFERRLSLPVCSMPEGIPDIAPFRDRLDQLTKKLSDPGVFNDPRKAADFSREHQKLGRLVEVFESLEKAEAQLAENEELLREAEADPELAEIARGETETLTEQVEALKREVLLLMIPPEASDDRNIVMEIRGGAGGDEANLFAGDLYRMYTRFAERNRWQVEPLSISESEVGGFKEAIFLLKGERAYKRLKFESGVHRVQRVPETESQGRIHTSTATVAVLPEAQEVDVQIDPNELEITVSRASGPGGQGVNTTDSAVQIIHKPTGITVNCADERSQLKNKAKALAVLRSRLLKAKEEEEQKKYAENRRSQVGTGDRSERIRTYNFPQSRVTDHRIGFNSHDLDAIMDGSLEELITALSEADLQDKLSALLEEKAAISESRSETS